MSTKVSYVKYISRLIDLKQYIIEQLPNYTLINLIKKTTKTKTLLNSEIILEFNGVLDYSDIEIINTSLHSYTNPVTPIITKIDSKNINSIKINSIDYIVITSFTYEGYITHKLIDLINIISMKNTFENFSYSARIWDVNNKKVICENTNLSNTDNISQSLETISNLPKYSSIFELQCKLNTYNSFGIIVNGLELVYHLE